MEGLESQLAASALKRALPVPVVEVGSVVVVAVEDAMVGR